MKHLKSFESYEIETEKEVCNACGCDCNVCVCDDCDCGSDWKSLEEKTSYKKSGLKNPKKADLNKDKKISKYEKARGKAIQKSMQDEKEESTSGLSAKQKKLPEGLRKAIMKRNRK